MTNITFVFGLFFITSCSSLNTTNSDSELTSFNGPLSEIEYINKQIEQGTYNKQLLLRKTELFLEAAKNESIPSLRKPFYRNAYNTSQKGISDFVEYTAVFNRVMNESWSFEHNNGVRLLQLRSTDATSDERLSQAIDHLENAIIVQPDSLASYNVISTAYYSGGLYADAERTLKNLLEVSSDTDLNTSIREQLAFIYLESGDTRSAVSEYQKLHQENSSSMIMLHGLINAYIIDNQPEKAAQELQKLTEEYPDRATYYESLASVKYQLFETGITSLISGEQEPANIQIYVQDLLSNASEINEIFEHLSDNSLLYEDNMHQIAGYNLNGASYMEVLRKDVMLPDSVIELVNETETKLLQSSLQYWEDLTDLNPDNIEYLHNLYAIYNKLEMYDKAEILEQTYNF